MKWDGAGAFGRGREEEGVGGNGVGRRKRKFTIQTLELLVCAPYAACCTLLAASYSLHATES